MKVNEILQGNEGVQCVMTVMLTMMYDIIVIVIACEQAFGRAGNRRERDKRTLPPFPSLSLLFFFPKQRACSQAIIVSFRYSKPNDTPAIHAFATQIGFIVTCNYIHYH